LSTSDQHISFLLGSGFSANAGYPIGNQLNELLLNVADLNVSFHSSGQLIPPLNGKKQLVSPRSSWDFKLDFLIELIQYYNNKIKSFDYEVFYDFLLLQAESDKNILKLAKSRSNSIVGETDLIRGSITILNQLVHYLLKDNDDNNNYENAGYYLKPLFDGYSGFLNCVDALKKEHTIHFHTLNHDVYLERLNRTEWFGGDLCDGFEELGSSYYGKLVVDGRDYMSRLKYFTGNYSTNVRLYKLHGSLDYVLFHTLDGGSLVPDNYIKTKFGISYSNLYKEVGGKKGLEYFNYWINYHPDFLTGTSSKIEKYKEPTLFKKLFSLFQENLKKSDKLIIIGYGAKDSEVNRILLSHFDHKYKPVVIVDPYPNQTLKDLGETLNAKFVTTNINDIKIDELE
jgi:hypothetical protein